MRRFYASIESFHDEGITLGREETRHLKNVLRMTFGEQIAIFDGLGNEFLCEIVGTVKRKTSLKIIKQISPGMPESHLDLTIAVSVLKGDKFDLAIQKAVELGVNKFIPLLTQRCDVRLRKIDPKIGRWEKIIIGATKQCGRARLMEITQPMNYKEFVQKTDGVTILFAERDGKSFSKIKTSKEITAIIGSEGGWEDSELEFAKQKGLQIVTFGGRILRAETAAISIPAILQHRFGDMN